MGDPLLTIRDLRTHFIMKNMVVRAVDGVDIDVYRRKVTCIVGESGCGKSMTALSIMRLVPQPRGKIVSGNVMFNGIDLLKVSRREITEIRGDDIAMIFQEPMTALNPVLTIGRQITEILVTHRQIGKRAAQTKAVEMLRVVGIPRPGEIMNEYSHQLSGGLRQRVMIAMAMVCEPKLLIADEPTTALDVSIQAQVLDLIRDMQKEFGMSVILITHDLGVVAEMADHVVVMYAGQVVESTSADEIFDVPAHPYTKGLLASIPTFGEEREVLYAIPGTVPDAAAYSVGCRFVDRCSIAQPSCRENMPELRQTSPGHFVRCDLVSGRCQDD